MKKILYIILVAGFIEACGKSSEQRTYDSKSVDAGSIIDPLDLLTKAFKDKQYLFIATANHSNGYRYELLKKLISRPEIANELKTIVLERRSDMDTYYQRASTGHLNFAHNTTEKEKFIESLCRSPEWATNDLDFLHFIGMQNTTGRINVRVRAIDSVTSETIAEDSKRLAGMINNKGELVPIAFESRGCSLEFPYPIFETSASREVETAKLFENRVADLEGKTIILYHYMHLLPPTFRSCHPDVAQDTGKWFTAMAPSAWSTIIFEKFPNIRDRSAIILLDEKDVDTDDASSAYNPEGVLRITDQIVPKGTVKDSGFWMPAMQANVPAMDGFKKTSYIHTYNDGKHETDKSIADVFDGVVSVVEAQGRFPLKEPRELFPEICAEK
jgi:hypothetical protein